MKKVVQLTESDIKKLIKRIIEAEDSNQDSNDLSNKLKEIDDYITDNGRQKPEGNYALISRVLKAAYDQKFHPTYLMEYLYKNMKN